METAEKQRDQNWIEQSIVRWRSDLIYLLSSYIKNWTRFWIVLELCHASNMRIKNFFFSHWLFVQLLSAFFCICVHTFIFVFVCSTPTRCRLKRVNHNLIMVLEGKHFYGIISFWQVVKRLTVWCLITSSISIVLACVWLFSYFQSLTLNCHFFPLKHSSSIKCLYTMGFS
jgi:hypothetical protein